MKTVNPVRTFWAISILAGQAIGCGDSKIPSDQPNNAMTTDDGGGARVDGATVYSNREYLARLDAGYFKQNCAMGFDISGNVFSEYADALQRKLAFQGEIQGSPDFSKQSGFFTVKITAGGAAYGTAFPADKYTVVKWFDFTGGTVAYRIANKTTATDAGTAYDSVRDTREAAEADFTDANAYFKVYCCPFATHYPDLRLAGVFRATTGTKGIVAEHVPDPTNAGKTLFQLTAYEDLDAKTVFLQGTIRRTSDLTAPFGYWRILVRDPGLSGFAVNQYTVAAWQNWDGSQVQFALPQLAGFPSTTPVEEDALLTFDVAAGYFVFDTNYQRL